MQQTMLNMHTQKLFHFIVVLENDVNFLFFHIFRCCTLAYVIGLGLSNSLNSLSSSPSSCSIRTKKWPTASSDWMAWIFYSSTLETNSCWDNWLFHFIHTEVGGHVYCSGLVQPNRCWQVQNIKYVILFSVSLDTITDFFY